MKSNFYGYYPLSEDEQKELWEKCIFIFDTNVLLDLYRVPATTCGEYLDLLTSLSDRAWIPFHVGLEFQKGRHGVIHSAKKDIAETIEKTDTLHREFTEAFKRLEIEKRQIGIEPEPLIEAFNKARQAIREALVKAESSQLDTPSPDKVRETISSIFDGKVGAAPNSQADLDQQISDGEMRYENSIPPGFKDKSKEKDASNVYYFDGIKYEKKYGDLIIWKQILSHARYNEISNIIFVTSDQKDDWWWRENGKTIGPRPELRREIQSDAKVDNFWMYSSKSFLVAAQKFMHAKVSKQSVDDISDVEDQRQVLSHIKNVILREPPRKMTRRLSASGAAVIEDFGFYLANNYDRVDEAEDIDFVAYSDLDDAVVGYEVRVISPMRIKSISRTAELYANLSQKYISKYSLSKFIFAVIIDMGSDSSIVQNTDFIIEEFLKSLTALSLKYLSVEFYFYDQDAGFDRFAEF